MSFWGPLPFLVLESIVLNGCARGVDAVAQCLVSYSSMELDAPSSGWPYDHGLDLSGSSCFRASYPLLFDVTMSPASTLRHPLTFALVTALSLSSGLAPPRHDAFAGAYPSSSHCFGVGADHLTRRSRSVLPSLHLSLTHLPRIQAARSLPLPSLSHLQCPLFDVTARRLLVPSP